MWLILSDLHLGNPLFDKSGSLYSLITSPKYEKILILGDLLDSWELPVSKIVDKYNILITLLRSKKDSLLIVKGNHDPDLDELKQVFPQAVVLKHITYDKYTFVHGDEFNGAMNKYAPFMRLLFPIQWVLERFGIDLQYFFTKILYSISEKMNKPYYDNLVLDVENAAVEKYKHVIMGHTHFPKTSISSTHTYVNCGDWIHHQTYVEFDGINFSLRK